MDKRIIAISGKLKIEKKIPIPETRGRRADKNRFPFKRMQVGDSFRIPIQPKISLQKLKNLLYQDTYSMKKAKKLPKSFRIITCQGRHGLRVWRIK